MFQHILNGLSAAGNVLDLPGSSVRDALAFKNPFDQYLTPLHDANRTTGRDLLRSYGMAGQHDSWGNFAGGLAAEIATDPTNLISGKAILNAMRGRRAVATANVPIRAANSRSLLQRASGYMPEEIIPHLHPSLTVPVSDEIGVLPKRMYHGTPAAYDHPDPAKWSSENLHGWGQYHTDSTEIAGGKGGYWEKGMKQPEYTMEPTSISDLANARRKMENDFFDSLPATTDQNTLSGRERMRKLHLSAMTNDKEVAEHAIISLKDRPDGAISKYLAARFGSDWRSKMMPYVNHVQTATGDPANVRMQYLDIRNPFDIDKTYDLKKSGILDVLEKHKHEWKDNFIRERLFEAATKKRAANVENLVTEVGQARVAKRILRELDNGTFKHFGTTHSGVESHWKKSLEESRNKIAESFKRRHDTPVTGDEVSRSIKTHLGVEHIHPIVKELGYDGIIHTGGRGDRLKHLVAIAHDPSQIYKPFIAPALQPELTMPSARNGLKAGLPAYNVLARSRRGKK